MNLCLAFQTVPAVSPDINFMLILPEMIVSVVGVIIMLIDAFTRRSDQRWVTGLLSLAGLGAAAATCVLMWDDPAGVREAFNLSLIHI